jgi:hypothetical protein
MSHPKLPFSVIFLCIAFNVLGQENGIKIPSFNDKYSNYIRQLENNDLDIDYADFRNSFLESKQFSKKGMNYDSLKRQVFDEIKSRNYNKIITLTKSMLSIDYTSMFAHKYLQQTYKVLGDSINQKKYHDIEFGLLNSIMKSGDGKACATGWHVTQIEEEYFIIGMAGGQFQSQSITNGGKNMCDMLQIKTEEGEIKNYYFEANKIFEMEKKMFGL